MEPETSSCTVRRQGPVQRDRRATESWTGAPGGETKATELRTPLGAGEDQAGGWRTHWESREVRGQPAHAAG